MVELCKLGLGQDASILARNIFEQAVIVRYVYIDPNAKDAKLLRYADHGLIEWYKRVNALQNVKTIKNSEHDKLLNIKKDPLFLIAKNLNREYKKLKEKSHWSGKSIEEICNEVGYQDNYTLVYRIASQFTHSTPMSAKEYFLETTEGDWYFDSSSSNNWVEESLQIAFSNFLEIVTQCDKTFKCGIDTDLISLQKEYKNYLLEISQRE